MNNRLSDRPVSRRSLLQTFGAVGAAGLLAGCSTTERKDASGKAPTTATGTPDSDIPDSDIPDGISDSFFDNGSTVRLEEVASGLTSPSALLTANEDTDRRFILDQVGTVYVHDADGLQSTPFLDLTDDIVALGEGLPSWVPYDERGLLGLAFHPEFAANGLFYVRYSAPSQDADIDHRERLSEFSVTESGSAADPDSERVLMDMAWERPIHQSGTIEFGPDGYLYGSLGDGLNPHNAQKVYTLKGGIFRIDVDGETEELPYAIPEDNPLVGEDGRAELYAWGLRNPWKMAFSGDQLIAGDVGQATWEEINVIESGANYGWPLKEGTYCHDPQQGTSSEEQCVVESDRGETLVDPVVEFPHFDDEGDAVGFAVIGGHIHTGSIAALDETYVFGVFTSSFTAAAGRLLAATPQESGLWPVTELQVEGGLDIQVLSLGQDGNDSYVLGTRAALSEDPLSQDEGVVYRLTA
ncbi:glucose dehydrogenase [Haloarcula sp. CBA1130]|uniref:PQQ-dependent sugar dehydrogenase n=1 Tax=unclassified Haloarcula TaxID=2624677 RepID=UPI001243B6EA|nr:MULTISPECIES: PQQ-dependent sugar dehydrogenase [unclassified Haloarcula]KAA9396493.1 glucose dehydrogenase [Haloarcula sp. CBA1130]KAA9397650.1 glucose dehydrogenase [Haloarcula sp. CBA1129]